ncbi:MAG: hypothetical protein QOG71_3113 [Pyrinomonadaceae bacterium]|nr:hypothetical protein [Pyrinomonadaceae bacterium]
MDTVVCPACKTVNAGVTAASACSQCGASLAPALIEQSVNKLKQLTARFEEANAPSFKSFNGFGTTLLDYRALPDGTYEATRWAIALFLPLFPIASYVIQPTGQERTYGSETSKFRIIARTPLAATRIIRTYLLAAVGILPIITGSLYSGVVNRTLGGLPAFGAMILCFAWAIYIIFFKLKNEGAAYKTVAATT